MTQVEPTTPDAETSGTTSVPSVASAFAPLLDVRLPIEVILGTTTLSVRACLLLERNSIVPLAQAAGVDLQLAANGIVLARGEVVIVEDSTAVRVTEIEGQGALELP